MPKPRPQRRQEPDRANGAEALAALLQGMPPIAAPDAGQLVLGSMPGAESLRLRQYYAHPRNHFWPIAGELFGAGPALDYDARVAALKKAGVAVWDVLGACRRPGSLDASIDQESVRVNDFAGFFATHPQVRRVAFNGAYAEAMFRTRVQLGGVELPEDLAFVRLPSTSPANASVPYGEKLRLWAAALGGGR
jgi:hypoxanthine-DNA glycosylase